MLLSHLWFSFIADEVWRRLKSPVATALFTACDDGVCIHLKTGARELKRFMQRVDDWSFMNHYRLIVEDFFHHVHGAWRIQRRFTAMQLFCFLQQ